MAFPSPPASVSKHQIDQAWYNLRGYLGSSVAVANWEGVLLVGLDGDDSTAQRNSLTNKYLTIQAALNDAQVGDTVWVGPGTYEENITWPSVNRVTLTGFGMYETLIIGSNPDQTINITPSSAVLLATIKNIAVGHEIALPAITVNGSSDAANLNPLVIENVICISGTQVLIESANKIDVKNLVLETGIDLTLTAVSQAIFEQCRLRDVVVNYPEAPANPPAQGPGGTTIFNSSTLEYIVALNLAKIVLMKDTQCSQITADLIDSTQGLNVYVGTVWCFGKVIGDINIGFTMTEQSGEIARFDYAEIGGLLGVVGRPLTSQFQTLNFRNAILYNTGNHTADAWSIVDLRGALFNQSSLVTFLTGSFDRTNHYILDSGALGAGPRTIDIVPPYPAGTIDYTVINESNGITDRIGITLKSAVDFELTKNVDSGADLRLLLVRPYD